MPPLVIENAMHVEGSEKGEVVRRMFESRSIGDKRRSIGDKREEMKRITTRKSLEAWDVASKIEA